LLHNEHKTHSLHIARQCNGYRLEHTNILPNHQILVLLHCAAFGNLARNEYAVHLVNNGAVRQATIKGFPENCTEIEAYATNSSLSIQKIKTSKTTDGSITVELSPVSFVTVKTK